MDARRVAFLLGGRVVGRNRVSAPGPGHSRKDRSLSIKLDPRAPEGFLVYSHAGDSWAESRDHVREKLGLPAWQPGDDQDRRVPASKIERFDRAAVNAEVSPREWTKDDIRRINWARDIWREGRDPNNTIAEIYLKQHRKLELNDGLAGNVLRFHPAVPWRCEDTGQTIKVPALIAAFRSIDDNAVTGIQRVRLNADGSKYGRRMLGIVERAAVKLAMPDNGTLVIGEGVETCLAAIQLGFKPAWAVGSAGSISRFPVIAGVKQITLLGENDATSAGAVEICNERWQSAGRTVSIVLPDDGYGDLNDELMAVAP
jgi:putative DNA primase/helicase